MENKKVIVLVVGCEADKTSQAVLRIIETVKDREIIIVSQSEKLTMKDLQDKGFNDINIHGINIPEESLKIKNYFDNNKSDVKRKKWQSPYKYHR